MKSSDKKIKLGFFSTATYDDGILVSEVAKNNNFGFIEGDKFIPPRPFLTTLPFYKGKEWTSLAYEITKKYFKTTRHPSIAGALDYLFPILAPLMLEHLREAIIAWSDPPNSPLTIAKKGSSNPLIDTGHMKNTATYEITS